MSTDQKNWEADFDTKFDNLHQILSWGHELCLCNKFSNQECHETVKDFIRSLLTQTRNDVIGECIKSLPQDTDPSENVMFTVGYSRCHLQSVKALTKLKK